MNDLLFTLFQLLSPARLHTFFHYSLLSLAFSSPAFTFILAPYTLLIRLTDIELSTYSNEANTRIHSRSFGGCSSAGNSTSSGRAYHYR